MRWLVVLAALVIVTACDDGPQVVWEGRAKCYALDGSVYAEYHYKFVGLFRYDFETGSALVLPKNCERRSWKMAVGQ
ncbi:hypothetical protein LCGC14_1263630 [marine sediment metagenome]|uniref:Lipoprotein n=1 Tax=marine sediment metagenome TaxID=412755 RepID=A0A0F9KZY9_9ZZZZ